MTKYANLIKYSDVEPFEIIATSKSGKQITIREMDATCLLYTSDAADE